MKKKRKSTIGEKDKKYLQSLHWVTEVLQQYVDKSLSVSEQKIVEEQLNRLDANTKYQTDLSDKQLLQSEQRVKQRIYLTLATKNSQVQARRTDPKNTPTLKLRFLHKAVAVASVVIMLLGGSYWMYQTEGSFVSNYWNASPQKTSVTSTQMRELKSVRLPDGTVIHANGNTKINYIAKSYNQNKREIWLEGEAFFEVAKNAKKPFIIHSGKLTTTVKGTSFNVKAYPDIGEISVSVKTGKVEVANATGLMGVLTPNRELVYNNDAQKHYIRNRNWKSALAWRSQRLVLDNANSIELKLRIQQLFGVELLIEDTALLQTRFGLSSRKGAKLSEVLELLKLLYDMDYKKINEKQIKITKNNTDK